MSPRTEGWSRAKSITKERDGGECCICGLTSDLEVHHIIPFHRCQHNELWNLMTVQKEVHVLVNGEKYQIYNYKNRTNQSKHISLLKIILKEDISSVEKMRLVEKWSMRPGNSASTSNIILLRKYIEYITNRGFSVDISGYFKANGNVNLLWGISHENYKH